MGNVYTVGPNEALVVSGGCGTREKRTVVGGWAWAWAFVSDVQNISLEVMTLNPVCESVETAAGEGFLNLCTFFFRFLPKTSHGIFPKLCMNSQDHNRH